MARASGALALSGDGMTAKPASASSYGDLAVRVGSALAMGALALAAVIAGGVWFAALAACCGAVMMWEWRRISAPGAAI